LIDGKLHTYANGEMYYTLKGKHAKVSVLWNYEAPEGTGDMHYSIMHGTKSNLIIKQGATENFKSVLYIESKGDSDFNRILIVLLRTKSQKDFQVPQWKKWEIVHVKLIFQRNSRSDTKHILPKL
jgi:hypothetical protein